MLCQHRRDRDPRKIVVGERGVADMARKEDRVVGLARDQQFAIAEVPGAKSELMNTR